MNDATRLLSLLLLAVELATHPSIFHKQKIKTGNPNTNF
jgi:hypothetical protein